MCAFHVLFDMYKCDVSVCFDMCVVFVVVEFSLFLLTRCCMLCESGVSVWDVVIFV